MSASTLNVLSIIVSAIAIVTFLITLFKLATQLGVVLERLQNNTDNTTVIRQQLCDITKNLSNHDVCLATHETKINEIKATVDEIKVEIKEKKQD